MRSVADFFEEGKTYQSKSKRDAKYGVSRFTFFYVGKRRGQNFGLADYIFTGLASGEHAPEVMLVGQADWDADWLEEVTDDLADTDASTQPAG